MIKVPLRHVVSVILSSVIAFAVFMGGTWLLERYSNSVTYPAYMASLNLSPGSVGTKPLADTPQARSIADLESMDTFFVEGRVYTNTPIKGDNGRIYYELKLESGESVFVRYNRDAVESLENNIRRMPVGRWLPLPEEQIGRAEAVSVGVEDHYIDMKGDFERVKTEGQVFVDQPLYRYIALGTLPMFFILYFGLAVFFKKKGWFMAKANTGR